MKRLLHLASLALVALLIGCATGAKAPSTNEALRTAYDSVDAYVQVVTASLARGRITEAQAEKASASAKKARESINTAAAAFRACEPAKPCVVYADLMKGLQPALLELERDLRAKEGALK